MLNLLDHFFPNKFWYRVGPSGLDACEKTTLIYKLKYGEVIENIPTISVIFTTANFNILCSQGTLRCTYSAIVWLVDGADHDRLVESVEELQDLVTPEGSNTLSMNAPILILTTKQDLPNTIPLDEIRRKFIWMRGCCLWSVSYIGRRIQRPPVRLRLAAEHLQKLSAT
ncbi:hypothetical protein EV360DRAFT_90050 [Lentinula raphanica]|nr:hypothetical protein EV360DRAFT_90050 [Lentinula raphanica]